MIVESTETVTLVGAGVSSRAEINRCRAIGPRLVAADGGARSCFEAGIAPEAIIGDLDSLGDIPGLDPKSVHAFIEQETTDFDKALRHISAPLILGVGFTGGRIDHELACYNVLVRQPDRRCILLGAKDMIFLAPPRLALELPAGTRVSLFPMGAVAGQSAGLKWPIEGINFAPDGRTGTSNEVIGPIELSFDAAKMLTILPKAFLEAVSETLQASDAWSPVL